MTEERRDELERVGELFAESPDPRPEAKEAARAALVARFEAAQRGAQPVRRGRHLVPERIAQAFKRRRVPYAFAAGACAAALVVATIIVTGNNGPTSAYAVEPQPSGLVFVSIRSLDDGKGLQQSLREAGVPAVVEFNDNSRRPFLFGRNDVPPGFRNIVASRDELSNGACTVILPAPAGAPGSEITVSLPYPESLGHLVGLDPGLRPTLRNSFEEIKKNFLRNFRETLSPAGFQRVLRLERQRRRLEREGKVRRYPGARAEAARVEKLNLQIPSFTFVPTQYLVPATEEEGVIFIIDPNGLEAGESLHLITTRGSLSAMAAYTKNAICTASGEPG